MTILSSVNGIHTDKISVLDRGLLYGDSAYEVCPGYGKKLFLYDEHLQRLKRNCNLLKIPEPAYGWDKIYDWIQELRATHPNPDHYIRFIVTRGITPINLHMYRNYTSEVIIIIMDLNEFPQTTYENGIKLHVSKVLRMAKTQLDPMIKSGNYLNNILALDDAKENGFDDALMLNIQGDICEATTANIFFLEHNTIYTPQIESGILDGITRSFLIHQVFPKLNLTVQESKISLNDLNKFQACFLSSSVKGITPVNRISSIPFDVQKIQNIRQLYDKIKRS